MDIERALRDYLVANVALVSGRVYPVHMPQAPTYPCATYTKVSGPRIHAMTEDTGLARPRFQVSCWAYDRDNHHTAYSTAKAVAEQVRDALQDYSGNMSPKEEIQTLYLGEATGGTYDLGIAGDMRTLAYDATAATITTEIEGVFGAGNVTAAPNDDFTIAFALSVGDSSLQADFTSLTGATATPSLSITQPYHAGVEVEAVLLENETDLYEHDVRVFQVALDFIIYHQE